MFNLHLDCENGKYPKKLQVYKKMKKVKEWTTCRISCNVDQKCDFFRWKVEIFYVFSCYPGFIVMNFVESQEMAEETVFPD